MGKAKILSMVVCIFLKFSQIGKMPEACEWLFLLPSSHWKAFVETLLGWHHCSLHLKGAFYKTVCRMLIFITPQGKKVVIYIKLRMSAQLICVPPPKEESRRTANLLEMLGATWGLIQEGKCFWRRKAETQRVWPRHLRYRWNQTTGDPIMYTLRWSRESFFLWGKYTQ